MSWPIVKLGDACERVSVGHVGTTSEFYTDESGIPFLRTQNVGPDGISLEDVKYITPEFHGLLKKSTLVAGDVVMSRVVSTSINCGIVPKSLDGANCANIILARPHKDHLDSKYLMYYLRSSDVQRKLLTRQVGSAQSVVNTSVLKTWEVPLPPLSEQKRIVAILEKADAIRRKRQQAIQLADDLLRAVFLDMFGDPVTNPKEWEVRPLSDLVSKLGDGLHGTPKYDESGDYYFINGNNLGGGFVVINENVKRVGEEEFKKHRKELTKNTMLVSINGTIGKVAFYQGEKVVLGKSVCYFNVIPERISSMYLYHLIGSHYFLRYTGGIETGSTIKNVSLKSMRELPVPVPSANLQDRFNVLAKKIESKKAKLSADHNLLDALFGSLSHNAFYGKL